MIEWIKENRQWVFSGAGVAIISALVSIIFLWGKNRWKEGRQSEHSLFKNLPEYKEHYEKPTHIGLSWIPSVILRIIYKPRHIAEQIHIDLRGESPVFLYLQGDTPYIDLYLDITNFSKIRLYSDRVLINVWFGQPVFNGVILRRYYIKPGQITKNIYFRYDLTTGQAAKISNYISDKNSPGKITMYLEAYFDTKAGRIFVDKVLERSKLI